MENIGVLGLLTREDVEKMTRPALIDLVMRFNEKTQQNTILAMPERNVLQRLVSAQHETPQPCEKIQVRKESCKES